MTTSEIKRELDKLSSRIKELEAQLENTVNEEPELERLGHGEPYFYIYGNSMNVAVTSEDSGYISDTDYINNNYFYTKKRAQEVADKIKFLMRLERFHDIYCPNYKPNWDNHSEEKWRIYYNHNAKKWICGNYSIVSFPPQSSFPTEEIAQRVCDILNREESENHDNS